MSAKHKSRKKSRSACVPHPKKSVRSMRGIPETNYGETKKISSFSLTPTAIDLLKDISHDLNISASELLERFARLGHEFKDQLSQEAKPEKLYGEVPEDLYKL